MPDIEIEVGGETYTFTAIDPGEDHAAVDTLEGMRKLAGTGLGIYQTMWKDADIKSWANFILYARNAVAAHYSIDPSQLFENWLDRHSKTIDREVLKTKITAAAAACNAAVSDITEGDLPAPE